MAKRGLDLIYGGGRVGLMGEIARTVKAGGARTIGIITERLMEAEMGDPDCDELIVVDTMRERKRLLRDRGDAFLMLPGGLGTYEEFFDTIVGRQLGEHDKPIGVVNSLGYYNPLIALVEHGIEHNFIKPAIRELFFVDPDPETVIEWTCSAPPVTIVTERFLPMGHEI